MVIVIIINKKIDIMKWMKKRQLRRNKNKFKMVFFSLISLALVLGVAIFVFWIKGTTYKSKKEPEQSVVQVESKNNSNSDSSSSKQVIYPTIYITGASGGVEPSDWLVDRILPIKNISAKKSLAIISNVNDKYKLEVKGKISEDNKFPLIEFGTKKGIISGALYSSALQKAMTYLTERYKVPWINLVGYSSGGTGAIYYMIDTANNSTFPPVNKYVSLEGEYNRGTNLQYGETLADILANGPSYKTPVYQYIADNYQKISSKTEMMFLEGDFDTEKQTDSAVPWADSFSIYHLLKKNGNEITTVLYSTQTSHSKAPKNPIVVKYIKNFIYGDS
ncbi:MAG: alpha/beta hydrolase [Lactococcus lactis]|nr:alpha/beta hydrolase [Lactococcus lactis]